MEPISPTVRRNNLLLLIVMIIFALALAISCFFWMRGVVQANGGNADPRSSDFVLPTPVRHLS